jgi:hypothetical protein
MSLQVLKLKNLFLNLNLIYYSIYNTLNLSITRKIKHFERSTLTTKKISKYKDNHPNSFQKLTFKNIFTINEPVSESQETVSDGYVTVFSDDSSMSIISGVGKRKTTTDDSYELDLMKKRAS